MASLYDYIPKYPMSISFGGKEINVSGIQKFEIEVDRCFAHYFVWVDTVQIAPLLPSGKKSTVVLTPTELSYGSLFNISNITLVCKILSLAYQSRRHRYIVELKCILNPKFLTKFKYIEPGKEKKEEIDKFDLMDL